MKDIEWLKKEIEEDIESWGGGNPDYFRGASDAYENVKDWLNQLLVPKQEVLSQEWIDEHRESTFDLDLDEDFETVFIKVEDLQNLLVPKQEEITHKQVEKYLLDKNIRVIDIDIYEEMQAELEELKNGATLSKTETVSDVVANFYEACDRLQGVMSMEVKETEKWK